MIIKHDGMRQLPHVIEATFRASSLLIDGDDAANQSNQDHRRSRYTDSIAANEFCRAIAESIGARDDRQAFEMPPNIFRELLD